MWNYQGDNGEELQLEKEFQRSSNALTTAVFYQFIPAETKKILADVKIQLITDAKILRFDCPSRRIAARLFKMSNLISFAVYGLKENLQLNFIPKLEILCTGQQFIPRLNPEKLVMDSLTAENQEKVPGTNLVIAELDLDLNELYQNPNPIYITQMSDQKVLFANRAALISNNRAAGEMVGKEIVALWDDDILQELMNRLERDRELWQYNYPGYRWAKGENSRIWQRDRYMFSANYKLVDFLGSMCRYCIITSAEKMPLQPV